MFFFNRKSEIYNKKKYLPWEQRASKVPAVARFLALLFVYLAAQLGGGNQAERRGLFKPDAFWEIEPFMQSLLPL